MAISMTCTKVENRSSESISGYLYLPFVTAISFSLWHGYGTKVSIAIELPGTPATSRDGCGLFICPVGKEAEHGDVVRANDTEMASIKRGNISDLEPFGHRDDAGIGAT